MERLTGNLKATLKGEDCVYIELIFSGSVFLAVRFQEVVRMAWGSASGPQCSGWCLIRRIQRVCMFIPPPPVLRCQSDCEMGKNTAPEGSSR